MNPLKAHAKAFRALAKAASAGADLRAEQGAGPESRALQDLAGVYAMAADDLDAQIPTIETPSKERPK